MDALSTLYGDVVDKNALVSKKTDHTSKSWGSFVDDRSREINFNLKKNDSINLIPVSRIPSKYRSIFRAFPYFNVVQSTVFEDAFYTDKPLIVCAPTGSGKTVIFELGIIRLLMLISDLGQKSSRYKVVYMAPVKSLCNERYVDWKEKFEPLGALCIQLTGDSEVEDYFELQKYTIILTTPEKWDSVTRVWKNNKNLFQMVKLLLIDEIHLLNEEERGATMEAALSRMKTIQSVIHSESLQKSKNDLSLRFIAVSATFPNVEDASEWLSTTVNKGVSYKLNENLRPVQLNRVVLGYPTSNNVSEFKFDLMLSYKLGNVITTYSEGLPTLVFCSTRKSVVQTADILTKTNKFVANASHKQCLIDSANTVHENKLRECMLSGIGFHHAGLQMEDRRLVEQMFLDSKLLVLICTSTLAMGVNFPAHLVIIKSTAQYAAGCYREYSETQIFQMIGRAGRPQFDTHATAVIMTKSSLKTKYESIVSGSQLIESSLHKHIVEHLNAEIVLGTITDISIAMEWLKATFLFQRIFKNPKHYGISMELSKEKIERKLQDMCIKELNGLRKYGLIYMDGDSFNLRPTDTGRLMAKYYIAFETMKNFASLTGKEEMRELLALVSSCKEFEDIQLRVNEKKILNQLNKNKYSSIRYPLPGKIKTREMKINCLIQATLGCLPITEPQFNQDTSRIFRNGIRVTQCLAECLTLDPKGFSVLYTSIVLAKCFKARLWENSRYVSKQIEKIGNTLATILVNSGISSFDSLLKTHPREIELILNRKPPFGNTIIDSVKYLPKYEVEIEQIFTGKSENITICVRVYLKNSEDLLERRTTNDSHGCYLVIGDSENAILLCKKIRDFELLQNEGWMKKLDVRQSEYLKELKINLISNSYVGLDVNKTFTPQCKPQTSNLPKPALKNHLEDTPKLQATATTTAQSETRTCNHKCLDKAKCRHLCCKEGVPLPPPARKTQMDTFMEQLEIKSNVFPSKRLKVSRDIWDQDFEDLQEDNHNSYCSDRYKTYESKDQTLPQVYSDEWNHEFEDAREDCHYYNMNDKTMRDIEDERNTLSKCEDNTEDCVAQSLMEEWENEFNIEDVWDDVENAVESKPKMESTPVKVSFDIDFNNFNHEIETMECQEKSKKLNQFTEETPPEAKTSSPKREVWSKEKCNDPVAQEELLNMILTHLSSRFISIKK